jgi:SAM-dependent methyltransferase
MQSLRGSDMENLFEHIYINNIWGRHTESKSGPGSSLSYTTNIRQEIVSLLNNANIEIFLDAPCGDFNWMKAVDLSTTVKYIGGDISPSLISDVREKYADDQRSFRVFNITSDVFPKADVWFCRHCFFHLPYEDILSALSLFAASEIPLLFATTDINVNGLDNTNDITILARGGFRFLDLFAPPFELPRDVLFWAADCVYPDPRREMCVWTRQQVANALPGMRAKIMAR